jgi:Flp pilus assembly protein TadG
MLRTRRKHARSGAAALEFAIIAPVLLIILLGTIETCSMIFLQQSLTIGAYEAARVSIIPNATTSDVVDAAEKLLDTRKVQGYSITVTPSNFPSAAYGTFIRVEVRAPCNSNSSFSPFFYNSKTLTGSVEMMKEF